MYVYSYQFLDPTPDAYTKSDALISSQIQSHACGSYTNIVQCHPYVIILSDSFQLTLF